MKKLLFLAILFIPFITFGQVEVTSLGHLKLNAINSNTGATDLIARQPDGTLVIRSVFTLPSNLSVMTENSANNRVGIRNSNPQFTLDVVHANGSPASGSSDPHNGLNIRHEGSGNHQWTFYVSNTSGTLSLYKNTIKEIEFTVDGSVNFLSDRNAKKDISPMSKGLDLIMDLNPSRYRYKSSNSGKLCYGFIAQELNTVIPELVSVSNEDGDETYAVDYIGLIPILTKSIQEQQALIEKQSKEIALLKEAVEKLME